jgi:hypothetical protein
MNYLELVNKCLVELNYKQVNAFSELIKNDHKKLKNIINVLNTEICGSTRWNFLQRKSELNLPKNIGEIENTIDGRIETLIVDGVKFEYYPNFEKFFVNSQPSNTYSLYNDKILLPLFNKDKKVEVLYYTKNCVKNSDGIEKLLFEDSDDTSLIPATFAEPLLVYGACMRLKGNPQHVRFSYWLSMYNEALANMRSQISDSMDEIPIVKLYRR